MRPLLAILLLASLSMRSLARANQELTLGRTVLEFFVDESGKAKDVKVVESTDQRYSDAAIAAVQKWTFEAKYRQRKMQMPFEFVVPPDKVSAGDAREKKTANQPSEPTPPSVTDRAGARSAPAGGVAHL